MKRIIVPVNFSEVSLDTLDFALSVANKMNYHLRLLSVIDTGGFFHFWRSGNKTSDEVEIKAQIEDYIAHNRERYTVEGGVFDYEIKRGSKIKTLVKTAADTEQNAYAVIIGINSEEATNSETFHIITEMTVPVISWRKGFTHKPIESILMPMGSKGPSQQKIPFVTGFARVMGAKIEVLGCADTELPSIVNRITLHVEQALDFIRQNDVECEAHFKFGAPVGNTIIEHATRQNTDVISMMTDIADDPIEMFTSTDTEYILNHAKTPVICIHPE